jgi:hypothetical protein
MVQNIGLFMSRDTARTMLQPVLHLTGAQLRQFPQRAGIACIPAHFFSHYPFLRFKILLIEDLFARRQSAMWKSLAL